jgi:hypothetical protein
MHNLKQYLPLLTTPPPFKPQVSDAQAPKRIDEPQNVSSEKSKAEGEAQAGMKREMVVRLLCCTASRSVGAEGR